MTRVGGIELKVTELNRKIVEIFTGLLFVRMARLRVCGSLEDEYIMGDVINFYKIKKYNVFQNDFLDMREDNSIEFGNKGTHLAVLYAPNGTGKTSFVEVIDSDGKDSNVRFKCKYKRVEYDENNKNGLFYVIKDHHGRNIINVKETDYLIGDNIQKEYLLKEELDKIYKELTLNIIYGKLKEYGYTTKTNN